MRFSDNQYVARARSDSMPGLCRYCSGECKSGQGCHGAESTDCEQCLNFADFFDAARPDTFNCTAECPPQRPYTDDARCTASDQEALR